jgi:hypothetical protein
MAGGGREEGEGEAVDDVIQHDNGWVVKRGMTCLGERQLR